MKYLIAFFAFAIAFPACAQETGSSRNLVMYPKGREAYAQKFRDRSEQYELEGRNYIDDLYTNAGENTTTRSEPMLPESTLDAVLDSAQPVSTSATSASSSPPEISNGTTITP